MNIWSSTLQHQKITFPEGIRVWSSLRMNRALNHLQHILIKTRKSPILLWFIITVRRHYSKAYNFKQVLLGGNPHVLFSIFFLFSFFCFVLLVTTPFSLILFHSGTQWSMSEGRVSALLLTLYFILIYWVILLSQNLEMFMLFLDFIWCWLNF